MRQVAYFISDLHLGSEQEPNAFLFQKFLDCVIEEKPRYLFLLGDIFDLWIAGHKFFINKYPVILNKLCALQRAGTEIHYFEGNHDLYLDKYFGCELGFQIHTGPVNLTLWRTRLRIEHGDQMDPTDRGYLFLRWFLRSVAMQFAAPRLPEKLIVQLGEKASLVSREYTSNRESAREDVVRGKILAHAQKMAELEAFDALVAGHVHVKEDVVFTTAKGHNVRVFNLGTWLEAPTILCLHEDGLWQWIDPKN